MTEAFTLLVDRVEDLSGRLAVLRAECTELRDHLTEINAKGPMPSPNDVIDLLRAMADGRKIEAIKAYRTLTGYGLKESKDAVEAVMSQFARSAA
jgi:ribosomal protein L7/L12